MNNPNLAYGFLTGQSPVPARHHLVHSMARPWRAMNRLYRWILQAVARPHA